jgi:hypothetical protein
VRHRPNLTRLLIFVCILGGAAGVATAVMHKPDTASAAAEPGPSPQPTGAAATPAPTPLAVQDCLPGSTGTYISRYGNVDVHCALSPDGRIWQWTGVAQRDNSYAAAGVGTTVTDSTGARWVSKLASGGSKVWVWLPQNNTGWHPPTASYPRTGVTPDN